MRKRIFAALLCLILFSVAYGQVANQTVSVMLTNGDVSIMTRLIVRYASIMTI